jgi:hypothetical protein
MTDQSSRREQAAPPVGSVAEEAARLVEAFATWSGTHAAADRARADDGPDDGPDDGSDDAAGADDARGTIDYSICVRSLDGHSRGKRGDGKSGEW